MTCHEIKLHLSVERDILIITLSGIIGFNMHLNLCWWNEVDRFSARRFFREISPHVADYYVWEPRPLKIIQPLPPRMPFSYDKTSKKRKSSYTDTVFEVWFGSEGLIIVAAWNRIWISFRNVMTEYISSRKFGKQHNSSTKNYIAISLYPTTADDFSQHLHVWIWMNKLIGQ